MAKSLFPENMLSTNELTLEGIASKLLYLQETFHLLHWQTIGYAEHVWIGGVYEYIQDFRDSVIEKLMGYTGRRISSVQIGNIVPAGAQSLLEEALSFAVSLKRYAESNGYLDISNMADDFSGTMAKNKYLSTLS